MVTLYPRRGSISQQDQIPVIEYLEERNRPRTVRRSRRPMRRVVVPRNAQRYNAQGRRS
jgi:hypothetical protein